MARTPLGAEQHEQAREQLDRAGEVRAAPVAGLGALRALRHRASAVPWLPFALLLALAAAARFAFIGTPGYDVRDYQEWARIVGEVGIGHAYSADYHPPVNWYNYPPFYLYVLRATAWLYEWLRPDAPWRGGLLVALLKTPPILADLALGVLLYRFVLRRRDRRLALWTAGAYLLNPGIVWDTAYWGGIDAFHALFLTAALVAAVERRPPLSWSLATLAVGSKLLALPGALAALPPVLRAAGPRHLVGAAGAALGTGLLLAAPIILAGQFGAMAIAMRRNVGNFAFASANAHNLWWLVTWGDGWRPDTTPLALGLTYRQAGLALFALCAVATLWWLWPHAAETAGAAPVLVAGAYLSFAFAILTTEAHENWTFALFAPLALAAALHHTRIYWCLYAALSVTFLANLALQDPPLRDLAGPGFDPWAYRLGIANAAAQCALFLWWSWLLVGERRSRRTMRELAGG